MGLKVVAMGIVYVYLIIIVYVIEISVKNVNGDKFCHVSCVKKIKVIITHTRLAIQTLVRRLIA